MWNSSASPPRLPRGWPPSLATSGRALPSSLLPPLLLPPALPPRPFPWGEQAAGLSPRTVIKFPKQFGSGEKPSHSPPPSSEEGGPPPALLTGRGKVIRAVRGVAGIGASRQQRGSQVHSAGATACSPGHPRRLRQPPAPPASSRSPSPAVRGGSSSALRSAASKPYRSRLLPSRLPLTSLRHINIRRQMHINLFSPVLQLPPLTACSSRGAPGKLRQPHQAGGFLPAGTWYCLVCSQGVLPPSCDKHQDSANASGLPPSGREKEPGQASNPPTGGRGGWAA